MGVSMFQSKKPQTELKFTTRAEAFSYMLMYMTEEKHADPLEAAQKANEFADIFAKNMGIPLKIEPEPQGVDKYLSMATKIANYIEEHPKVVEYGVPALTFVAGLFTGKKVEQANDNMYGQRPVPPQPQEEMDCENDEQKEAVQTAFNELSNTRALTSRTVISMYPFFKKHRDDLFELFNMVKTGGVKSLLSVRGGTLINNLRKG